jgi:outer membrane receptor protein involved in Fe transport
MRTTIFAFVVVMCVASAGWAQVDRATLGGVIRDPSNAIVLGASIKAVNIATGVEHLTSSSDGGVFLIVNLAPGEYVVEVSARGFQTAAQRLDLEIGQRARLDVTLPLGTVQENVKVEAAVPQLDTQSAVVGSVVSRREVAALPLAIRNWDDLLFTIPGVQGDRYTEQTGTTNAGRTGGVSIHGNRSLQNNFLLDGVDNNSISTNVQELSTQVSRPSIDAIDEFKVVTSPFTAEYGRAPGGAIVVTTKSGTNRITGSAYDYYRDERFDSKSFFAARARQDKPTNDQNQFGVSIGGPIVRNRAFFFVDFEGTRIKQGVLRTGRVATEAERNGVFSSTIRDPLTGQPFENNTIPQNRIDPIARSLMAMVPLPNASGTNNFIRQPNVEDSGERYLFKGDIKPGVNDNVFVRYIFTDRTRFVPGFFGGVLDGTSTSAWGRNFLKSHSTVVGWTRVLGPTLVNEARVSWARGISDGQQDPFGQVGLEFPGVPTNPAVAGGVIGIDMGSAHLRLGSPNFMPKYQHTDQVQYLNTVSWLRGRHSVKFGADVMAPMNNQYVDIPSTRGNLSFNGQFTGSTIADFLLGYARGAELSNVHVVNQRRHSYALFIQDDWRASDRLTLNLGLRYDFMSPSYERDNLMANFDPATASLVYAKSGALEDRALVKPDRNNIGPRVGVVYQLDDRTVLRGGYGMFFNGLDRIGSEDQLALNPPGLRNINQTTTSTTTPVLIMRNGFPSNYLDPSNIVLSRLLIRAASPSGESASFQQLAAGIERQLATDLVVSADLVGNIGRHIAVLRNLNQPLNGNGARPYPNFSHIQWRDPVGDSRYVGLDLAVEKRFGQGFSYRVAYTLSDSRDQAPEHLAASSGRPQNTNDIQAWEGPSDFDVRHRVVANLIAELPFGAGKPHLSEGVGGMLLGGWTVSGIYTARSGRPFTVTQGGLEGAVWVPNLVGDPKGAETVDSWFNAAAFQRVPAGTFGNAGRNVLRGPGYVTLDMSLQRRITVNNRVAATLRWDVFNLFDRANFGNPAGDITNTSTVGSISTLAGDPRVMQFSIRVHF